MFGMMENKNTQALLSIDKLKKFSVSMLLIHSVHNENSYFSFNIYIEQTINHNEFTPLFPPT